MSGPQPGPGWWLGSDGRWYPPEATRQYGNSYKENTDTRSEKKDNSPYVESIKALQELLKALQELLKTIRAFITPKKAILAVGVTIVIIVGMKVINVGPPTLGNPSLTPSKLLSNADMEQAAGGSWQSDAADPQAGTCFSLPASPSKSEAVGLSETLGATLDEVVDSFPTPEDASQAYTSFTSSENNCSFQNTDKEGVTTQFTVVPDSNAPNLDSASGLWDVEGVPVGLGGSSSHDGAVIAVRSGNLDAFAYILVDTSNSPSMTTLESNIEPALASKL